MTSKRQARDTRLKSLPTSERLVKSALIKKKEGRVLDAAEKHALKMSSDHGEILRLWEKLRATTTDDGNPGKEGDAQSMKKGAYEHKYPIVEKLMRLLEPKLANYIRTPSVSRVVQSMIKYGSPAQVEKLLKLVSRDFTNYATDAYAHFAISALIRHAPHDLYKQLLSNVMSAVPQLVSHKFGIEVIHSMYSSRWCSAVDRNLLLLAVFKDNVTVMKQWKGYPILEDVLQQNPSLQKRLLTRLFELCDKLVSQKGAVGYPFVQRLTYAFIRCGTRDEVCELCETLRPHVAAVAVTREGAPLASLVFSLTEPKQRKAILSDFKENLGPLSTNKYSAPVIARLFDLLYDPQILHKYLLRDVVAHLDQVVNSPYGYLIMMHLLTPTAERKARWVLPNWAQHNLYSMENKQWNRHTWLTANYEAETVQICEKPAMTSHLAALPSLVEAFLKLATATGSNEGKGEEEEPSSSTATTKKLERHHAALLAREILFVNEHQPAYKAALKLSPASVSALTRLAPARGKHDREGDEDNGDDGEEEEGSLERRPPPAKQPRSEGRPHRLPKVSSSLSGAKALKGQPKTAEEPPSRSAKTKDRALVKKAGNRSKGR